MDGEATDGNRTGKFNLRALALVVGIIVGLSTLAVNCSSLLGDGDGDGDGDDVVSPTTTAPIIGSTSVARAPFNVDVSFMEQVSLEEGEVGFVVVEVANLGIDERVGLTLDAVNATCVSDSPSQGEAFSVAGLETISFNCEIPDSRDGHGVVVKVSKDLFWVSEDSMAVGLLEHRVLVSTPGEVHAYDGEAVALELIVENVGNGVIGELDIGAPGFICAKGSAVGEIESVGGDGEVVDVAMPLSSQTALGDPMHPGQKVSFYCSSPPLEQGAHQVEFSAGEGAVGSLVHEIVVVSKSCNLGLGFDPSGARSAQQNWSGRTLFDGLKTESGLVDPEFCPRSAAVKTAEVSETLHGDDECPYVEILMGTKLDMGFKLKPVYIPQSECSFEVLSLQEVTSEQVADVVEIMPLLVLVLDGDPQAALVMYEAADLSCEATEWSSNVEVQKDSVDGRRNWLLTVNGCRPGG